MGFLGSAEALVATAIAGAMFPPPPPDITKWCEDNIIFDERSPMPGPFNIRRFAFLREIHEVLSPEHPCREVTIKGSAQWGKTVSIIQPTLGAWFEYSPLDALVVHPTQASATEWVDNKWAPMRRQAPSLRTIFGSGKGENKDAKFNQETIARNGSLKVASAGSPADLTGTSRRLVLMDDVSKFDMTDKGDPEALAENRASGFEDAKIARISTPLLKGTCRVSRAYARSDQRVFMVPCPHCGHEAPLTWENFKDSIDPEHLQRAHFTCDACGCAIEHKDKDNIVSLGRWVAQNPKGDHPGFFLWRAYAPQRDWASIAVDYAKAMGWTSMAVTSETEAALKKQIEGETEQTFYNDVLGLEYEQASSGPDWTELRDRVENSEDETNLGKGIVPACGVLLTAGVDFQDNRIEVQVVAWGPNRRSWPVDYVVIPHHISEQAGRDALDAFLKSFWRTSLGLPLKLDMMAIDGGTYTDDVWSWAKRHPWSRVIIVKGSSSQNGPTLMPMKFERKRDGRAKRRQKRGYMVNVSQLKGDFFTRLEKEDPEERGFVAPAKGLGDEYFRQITSEVRTLKRQRSGTITAQWDLVEPGRRNEGLDTYIYAEAAARRKGWASLREEQWAALEAERGIPPKSPQGDLFDAELMPPAIAAVKSTTGPKPRTRKITEMMP